MSTMRSQNRTIIYTLIALLAYAPCSFSWTRSGKIHDAVVRPHRSKERILLSLKPTSLGTFPRRRALSLRLQGKEQIMPDYERESTSRFFHASSGSLRESWETILSKLSSIRLRCRKFVPGSFRQKHKRKLLFLCLAAAALVVFFPLQAASATIGPSMTVALSEATAGAAADSATQQLVGYTTNPPISIHMVGSPVSRAAELRLTWRLLFASILGSAVGKERSGSNHHPAGVRTMALVALGAACFTICSMYGFAAAGRYDPSRMASNVASGVGFIGAGVITTTEINRQKNQNGKDDGTDSSGSIVHGLTTAAAIWLSAALGVTCGVGLHYMASTATLLTLSILRIGRVAQAIQDAADQKDKLRKLWKKTSPNESMYEREEREDRMLLRAIQRRVERRKDNKFRDEMESFIHFYEHPEEEVIKPTSIPLPKVIEPVKKPAPKEIEKEMEFHGSTASSANALQSPKENNKKIEAKKKQVHDDLGLYQGEDDQLIFMDRRPETGWNETDKMDA